MSMHTVTEGDRRLLSGCSFILAPLILLLLAFFLLRPVLQPWLESRKNPPATRLPDAPGDPASGGTASSRAPSAPIPPEAAP